MFYSRRDDSSAEVEIISSTPQQAFAIFAVALPCATIVALIRGWKKHSDALLKAGLGRIREARQSKLEFESLRLKDAPHFRHPSRATPPKHATTHCLTTAGGPREIVGERRSDEKAGYFNGT